VGNDLSTNNATGFTAVPAGCYDGSYYSLGHNAYFWSATQGVSVSAYGRYLGYSSAGVYLSGSRKYDGSSVRCLRDASSGGGESTAELPTVTTTAVSEVTVTTATCGGNVTADGGADVTACGVCWSTEQNPTVSGSHTTDGSSTGAFTSSLTGLTAGTTYYVRAYATNSAGTAYGEQLSFMTASNSGTDGQPCSGAATVTDYDGNTYNTVQIGLQCWMKENLRTTHYSNGANIPNGDYATSYTDPYYYDYPSSGFSLSERGYLYNWSAAMHGAASSEANPSGVQGICPTGWHLPSDAEWGQLIQYVRSQSHYCCGSSSIQIGKALAANSGWNSSSNTCAVGNNQSTNNATGLSVVPAGIFNGTYNGVGNNIRFWTSTAEESTYYAKTIFMSYSSADFLQNQSGNRCNYGFSVRCLRD